MCFLLLMWGGANVSTLGSSQLHSSPTAAARKGAWTRRALKQETGSWTSRGINWGSERKEVELALLGDLELLFLAEGPDEDRPLSPSISAGWPHLSPSTVSSLCHLQRRWVRAERAAGGAA